MQKPVMGSIALALLAVAGGVFIMRLRESDVRFCRALLEDLADGKPSVNRQIDWARLVALDVDVGATYAQLPSDQERARYRRAFIEHFSKGFRQAGGASKGFRHWRVHAREAQRVVVAADYEARQKTLLMTIPASGPKKLEAIRWQ